MINIVVWSFYSGVNIDTSTAISQYVFDQVLQALGGCIEQLVSYTLISNKIAANHIHRCL